MEAKNREERELIRKAQDIAARSIGRTVRVRTGSNIVTEGQIVSAEPHRFDHTPRTQFVVFKVTAACGINKVHRVFYLKQLPVSG